MVRLAGRLSASCCALTLALLLALPAAHAAPPPNDNFANAITLTGTSGRIDASVTDATIESGEPTSNAIFSNTPFVRSIWYRFVAPGAGKLTLKWDDVPKFGHLFSVAAYEGNSVDTLKTPPVSAVYCSCSTIADGFSIVAELVAGETVYIQVADDNSNNNPSGNAHFTYLFETSQPVQAVAAVLPVARSVAVGSPATIFGSVINTSAQTANCFVGMRSDIQADFQFEATDANHQFIRPLGWSVPTDAGKAANFVIGITPKAPLDSVEIPLYFDCDGSAPAVIISGLNTLLLSASNSPVADMVAVSATITNDGIANIAGPTGQGFFAAAVENIGVAATITATVDDNGKNLPVTTTICQTDPSTGACTNPATPGSSSSFTLANNQSATFTVFISGKGNVPFDPANNRLFLRFKTADGVTRGATGVAIRTQ